VGPVLFSSLVRWRRFVSALSLLHCFSSSRERSLREASLSIPELGCVAVQALSQVINTTFPIYALSACVFFRSWRVLDYFRSKDWLKRLWPREVRGLQSRDYRGFQ